ncbi:hypothetical protein Pcinc_015977 [Petrolisthes cinctipes]|uniref:FAM69 protein-kinase domain-containing protein n=1 Tax=Petrolisthes cinctipes TaxID=88211 RepID=A0AAE1KP70_PETCI|nr:hypothetical protein Pcinc_015977 [Petrolisthes cinctipes]
MKGGGDGVGVGVRENSINIDAPVLKPGGGGGGIRKEPSTKILNNLFQELAKEETCPLCLGTDLCEDIRAGFLSLTSPSPRTPHDGSLHYQASLGDSHPLTVKVPPPELLSRLDAAVCANASLEAGCNVATAAPRSILAAVSPPPQQQQQRQHSSSPILTPHTITQLFSLVQTPRSLVPLLMCPSTRLLAVLERTYDDNNDGALSLEERLALYTSIAVAPDIVVLKLLTKANLNVGLPRVVGVCGRVGVTEGELTPITTLLDEPFNVRASLAAQLLTLVDDFMEEDPDWYLFSESWEPDGVAVNREGEVVFTNLASVAVVDKKLFTDDYEDESDGGGGGGGGEVCNRECLQSFRSEVYTQGSDPDQTCGRVESVGSLMYAAVCVNILSDMKQHKFKDYFTSDKPPHVIRNTKGLLHSIPASDRPTIEQLLSECVEEVSSGGRLQSAQDLRDYLSDYLMDEEEEDEDDEDDDDDDDDGDPTGGEEEEGGEEGEGGTGVGGVGKGKEGGKDEDYDYGDD